MATEKFHINDVDRAILTALARYHYLTTDQAARLFYPRMVHGKREGQRRLKDLTTAGYTLCLNALPKPRQGSAPYVYTLARKGWRYLNELGVAVVPYFRPSEQRRLPDNSRFMTHRLATIDVMIAADCLSRDVPDVVCHRMLSERELKQGALKVAVPPAKNSLGDGTRRIAVIPDAWFELGVAGSQLFAIAVELDRGTEDQKVWREKVAAYTVWADGPYSHAFETDNLTIVVVCPDERRRKILRNWTYKELKARGLQDDFGTIFLFTATHPDTVSAKEFFFGYIWQDVVNDGVVSLLEVPLELLQEDVSGKGV